MPQRSRYCCDQLTQFLHNEHSNMQIVDGRPCVGPWPTVPFDFCPFHGTPLRAAPCVACHQEPCDPECGLRFDPDVFAVRAAVPLVDGSGA